MNREGRFRQDSPSPPIVFTQLFSGQQADSKHRPATQNFYKTSFSGGRRRELPRSRRLTRAELQVINPP
jgi:hypothetical protein